jgi:T4-like virus tail tube protein gp19
MSDVQPFRNFNFRVEIDAIPEAQFAEVIVPTASIAVVEYREGADKASC